MTPEAIRALREQLRFTEAELARALGVEVAEVRAWERAERFPTRRWVMAMERLRTQGSPAAPPPSDGDATRERIVFANLARPELWALIRKLAAHPELLERARELAKDYDDPASAD